MALLAFCGDEWNAIDEGDGKGTAKKSDQTLETRLHLAAKRYMHMIDGNHGIRERNVLRIVAAIGISRDQIDSTWLATFDSFGGARGTAAQR
jgi:hypothetical protein